MAKPRIIFMGTPEFAIPALQKLAAREDVDLRLVVTQPDQPSGRGKKLTSPPVKTAAVDLNLNLLQAVSLRQPEVKERIIAIQPDLVVVAAFGMILGKWILELPTYGCVNLHASLLPKYRGASPISAAIFGGDDVTGVTLMQMDRGLDTGDILDTIEVPIDQTDTTASLTPKLGIAAAELLDAKLSDLLAGEIDPMPQPGGATKTQPLTKNDGRIDWSKPAEHIERQIRAMWSWPRAWTLLPDGSRMQIHESMVQQTCRLSIGELGRDGESLQIGTGRGCIRLKRVQLPGGTPIEGHGLIQRLTPHVGSKLQV